MNSLAFDYVESWWIHIVLSHSGMRKAMALLTMLLSWEIRTEQVTIVFGKIKMEARTWTYDREKHFGHLVPRE
jgi:hypothetical protein